MTEPITLRTLALFLVGNRGAITRLASSRVTLLLGAAFVLSASLARNYDGAFIPGQPHVLLHGFAASIGNAILLFSLCFGLACMKTSPGSQPPFWQTFLSFLGLFWCTSPLAWLYAIPFERFLPAGEAISANYYLVGLVSLWRVTLITRVLTLLFGGSGIAVGVLVLFYSTVLVVLARFIPPVPLIDIMGGVHRSDAEAAIGSWYFLTMYFGIILAGLLFVASLIALANWNPAWAVPSVVPDRLSPAMRRTILAAVLIWIPALAFAQPEQYRRWNVERLLKSGRIAEGITELSSRSRDAYPRIWSPPPHLFYRENVPPLIDVITHLSTVADSAPDWVNAAYAEKAKTSLQWNLRGITNEDYFNDQQSPESALLCDFIARTDPSLTPELRERFRWAAECYRTPADQRRMFDAYQQNLNPR